MTHSTEKKVPKKSFKKSLKVKPKVKQGVERLSFQKPRQARIESKKFYTQEKKRYKLKKKKYKKLKSKKPLPYFNRMAAKKATLEAKSNYKAAQKIVQKAKKRDHTRVAYAVKSNAKAQIRQSLIVEPITKGMREDDLLKEMVESHQKIRKGVRRVKNAKMVGQLTGRISVNTVKHGYGFGNRLYNLSRGRGFHRTPKDRTTWAQAVKKARAFRHRLEVYKQAQKANAVSEIGQVFKGTKSIGQAIAKMVASHSILWGFLLFFVFVFLAVVVVLQTPKPAIQQEELALTETWKYVTKLDAEHTDDKNTFYSDIDPILFYMNNKFGDFENKSTSLQVGDLHGAKNIEGYLDKLWVALNGKKPDYQLSTMEKLMKDAHSIYAMKAQDLEDFHSAVDTFGYSTLDGQLSFPYKTDNLVIQERFGYEKNKEGKESFRSSITTPTTQGQTLLAPLTGEVTNGENSICITDEAQSERVTLSDTSSSRYENGAKVKAGQELALASNKELVITLEKKDEDTKKWETVNPAFYFPKVTYTQFTILSTDGFNPKGTMAQNALAVYNYLKPKGGTLEGIAAILGNFQQESSIDPTAIQSGQSFEDKLAYDPSVGGYAIGLAQWDTGRRVNLLNYAKAKKEPWTQIKTQMSFATEGDDPADRTIFMEIAQSKVGKSVPELTEYFCTHWERAGIANMQARVQNALNWYAFLKEESTGGGSSATVPAGIKDKLKNPLPNRQATDVSQGYPGNPYGIPGQCVWYCWNRWAQLGYHPPQVNWGNALNWAFTAPVHLHDSGPHVDDVVVFQPGVQGAGLEYGHVASIEYINPDGTFWVTEENATAGPGKLDWRLIHPGPGLTYIKPVK
ncbi:phage tail tip lysozyme [Lactococcus petauri]|uniref:phage tail tip lysozyme n=1 Tax=Lactococcus petauri TaxID=1940789 RepID=UPI001F5A1CEC|nr:phage tail tip lysozyme [Lactococcus petauri]